MTVKFIHIRECDEDGNILNNGGCTIAYSATKKEIFLNLALCHPRDQFCRKTGREVAAEKLHQEGPLDFIELNHPISEAVRLWFMQYYDVGLKKINGHYMTDWSEPPSFDIPDEVDEAVTFVPDFQVESLSESV